jgi:alcohol dehydrogenase (cytochrome c)
MTRAVGRTFVLGVFLACVIGGSRVAGVLAQQRPNGGQWTTYSGDDSGQRHSPLTQITPANVGRLAVQWLFQSGVTGRFEATPLVRDGIMYVTGPDNHAWALDARTGRQIWQYRRQLPDRLNICCGRVNRGFALRGERLYMTTLDAHLVALDAKTGNVVWDVEIDDHARGYTATVAPLIVKDKVIVGIAGAEYGVRGFIDAFDAETGKRAWRFWTVPEPGQPGGDTWLGDSWRHGGGSTWVTGAFDPALNLVYWGTGNPAPDSFGDVRLGDNLYTDSVVALDADTGKLRWHYQFTPHDVHDWDAVQVPILGELTIDGTPRKVLMTANRNGFFYTLDRTNGTLLRARPFVHTTWAQEIGRDGRPILLPANQIGPEGTVTCPDVAGGTNWMSPSFNPGTGLFYVTAREVCAKYYAFPQQFLEGHVYWGGAFEAIPGQPGYGALRAIDAVTGLVRWEFKYPKPSFGGTLSTASGLVFAGEEDGNVMAFDASSGKNLWRLQTGAALRAAPMSFMLNGRQYVVVLSGATVVALALPEGR